MQQKSELPEGWTWVEINQLGDLINGDRGKNYPSKKDHVDNGIPFINAGHLLNGKILIENMDFITEEKYNSLRSGKLTEGDLIYCLRGTLGKCAVFSGIKTGAIASSLVILRLNEKINNLYIYYFLISPLGRELIKLFDNGTAQPNLSAKCVSNYLVPLPPFAEQYRIVSAIEALFARLDAANEKLDSVLGVLKKFRESVLAAACDGRLTEEWRGRNPEVEDFKISVTDYCKKTESKKKNKSLNYEEEEIHSAPEMWATEYLENFIDIAGRIGWKGLKAEEYREEGPLLLSAHNLSSSKYVDFTSANHLSKERYFESPEIMLKNNDILLVKDGSGIGKIGIVNDLPQEATVNSSLLVIRSPEIIVTDFLYYQLSGPEMQNIVRQRITGSATPHLFQKDIKKFLIKIPPLPEQQEIVRRVDALFAFADSIESNVTAAREKTEKLRQSILAKAFSGKLVETEAEIAKREGRDYETAEVLLDKIKAEKGNKEKKR